MLNKRVWGAFLISSSPMGSNCVIYTTIAWLVVRLLSPMHIVPDFSNTCFPILIKTRLAKAILFPAIAKDELICKRIYIHLDIKLKVRVKILKMRTDFLKHPSATLYNICSSLLLKSASSLQNLVCISNVPLYLSNFIRKDCSSDSSSWK